MQNLFCEGLLENDIVKLLEVPKSDIHNHSTKGCRRAWLEEHLKRSFPNRPTDLTDLEECRNGLQLLSSHTAKILEECS